MQNTLEAKQHEKAYLAGACAPRTKCTNHNKKRKKERRRSVIYQVPVSKGTREQAAAGANALQETNRNQHSEDYGASEIEAARKTLNVFFIDGSSTKVLRSLLRTSCCLTQFHFNKSIRPRVSVTTALSILAVLRPNCSAGQEINQCTTFCCAKHKNQERCSFYTRE